MKVFRVHMHDALGAVQMATIELCKEAASTRSYEIIIDLLSSSALDGGRSVFFYKKQSYEA